MVSLFLMAIGYFVLLPMGDTLPKVAISCEPTLLLYIAGNFFVDANFRMNCPIVFVQLRIVTLNLLQ